MHTQRTILIVDGNASARTALASELAASGFAVIQATCAAEVAGRTLGREGPPDLLIIDCALPDSHGRDVVAGLRRAGSAVPVILLAAEADEDDIVSGLDAGADDFLVRPTRERELAARVRALLRSAARDAGEIRVGPALFDPATRRLSHPAAGRPLRLTEKEAALLMRLCRADGEPVTRQTLLREVWGYSPAASSHTVETHIYRLRRKIEPTPDSPALLVSESGGYRLCLDGGAPLRTRPVVMAGRAAGAAIPSRTMLEARPAA